MTRAAFLLLENANRPRHAPAPDILTEPFPARSVYETTAEPRLGVLHLFPSPLSSDAQPVGAVLNVRRVSFAPFAGAFTGGVHANEAKWGGRAVAGVVGGRVGGGHQPGRARAAAPVGGGHGPHATGGLGQPGARYLGAAEVRWRFLGGKLYAVGTGGTLLFPTSEGTLRPGAFASVGLGVDHAR